MGLPPPHIIFITGLPGIGRRSFIRKSVPSLLNFNKFVEIRIGEGDSLNEICARVADNIEPYSSREGFELILAEILNLSPNEARDRLLINLSAMVSAGELPVFVDDGGIVDSEGYLTGPIRTLVDSLIPNDDIYMFFVLRRRPNFSDFSSFPVVYLEKLRAAEVKRLLSMLAYKDDIEVQPSEISELSEYVAGYPPACYFAIHQAKNYGIPLLMENKTVLVQFRTAVFLKYLSKIALSEPEQGVLRMLATHSPLPLKVLSEVLNIGIIEISAIVIRLIDLSLVTINERGLYWIADPVASATTTAFGIPRSQEHEKLIAPLTRFIDERMTDVPLLELSRVLFRAGWLAKDESVQERVLHFSNDLIKLTETIYHSRHYSDSIKMGYLAIEERPDSETARSFLIRALIQEERWVEAEKEIKDMKKYSPLREVFFLTGFLERKRRRRRDAIVAYLQSQALGKKGAAISRELALCYFLEKEYEIAAKYIEEAQSKNTDNRYLVDLWAQIAVHRRDEDTARKALARLEIIDIPVYYFHRLSRVEFAFGNPELAEKASMQSIESSNESGIPFQVLAQLANCKIELGKTDEALSIINDLDKKFGHILNDVRLGLRCRLEIAKKNYQDVLSLFERFRDKGNYISIIIKQEALEGLLQNNKLEEGLRKQYEEELAEILTQIDDSQLVDFISELEFDGIRR